MPALFYRFPVEKTARCVLAAQNSMTFFNRRRERVRLLLSIFFGYLLEEKATKNLQPKSEYITNKTCTGYEAQKVSCLQTSTHNQNRKTTRWLELT